MKKINVVQISHFQQLANEDFYANVISKHLIAGHNHINRPHKHDFYAAMLFTHGSGIHEIDFTVYDVKPGSLFFLALGQTHHWQLSDDIEGYIFFHSQEFYDLIYIKDSVRDFGFFSSMSQSRHIALQKDQTDDVAQLFQKILSEYKEQNELKTQMVVSLMTQLYIDATRMMVNSESQNRHDYYSQRFLEFENLVESHFITEKAPSKYANMMHMTQKHLNRIVKTVVNKTTSDIIADRVILEAKRMLVYSENHFNQVAFDLGYEDYAYFSRLFKNKTNESPSDFLKKYGRHA